jgi:hypothetical protein
LTNHFPNAFKVFNKGRSRSESFQKKLNAFKQWGGKKAPGTDKQIKALATEMNYTKNDKPKRNKVATNIEKKGKWYDVLTGQRMKGEYDASRVPAWRDKDIIRDRGVIINTQTGEKLKTRTQKGRFLKRSRWTLTDKSGKVTRLYPSEKKVRKRRKRNVKLMVNNRKVGKSKRDKSGKSAKRKG